MNAQDIKDHPNKIYRKLFLSFLILAVITIALSSSFLYMNFSRSTVRLVNTSVQDNLSKISYSASLMKNNAKVLASQMYLDREIQLILFGISDKLIDFISPIERLETYIDSTPFIHSIYLYNGKKQKIYTDMGTRWMYDYREFFDHSFLKILEKSESSLHLKPIPRTVENISGIGSEGVYTFLFFSESE
jgi:two-component system, response regulator YesN